jgi:hypothetical protein
MFPQTDHRKSPPVRATGVAARSAAVLTAALVLIAAAAHPRAVTPADPGHQDSGRDNDLRPGAVDARSLPGGQAKWLFGRFSHTYEENAISGATHVSTIEYVGYQGRLNRTRPRVGHVYLGQIWVGRAGDDSAGDEVVTEVLLPRRTKFAISTSGPKRSVRCYTGDANGNSSQIRGRKCPNRPVKGAYGWEFSPPKGSWDVPNGRWVQIVFPLRSSRPLKGLTGSPHACLVGAVANLSGFRVGRLWDAPVGPETCPNPDGHGPYQGVYVSRGR